MGKKIRRLLALGLAVAIEFQPICVQANELNVIEEIPEVSLSFSGEGKGTKSSPYQITTATQLNEIRNDLSANYVLNNDIDMSSISNWIPIGNADAKFSGTIDGSNYTIKNLKINYDNQGLVDYVGLFGYCSSATIKNINLLDVSIIVNKQSQDYSENWGGTVYVGALAACAENVTNCTIRGKISVINCNDAYVGGIVGVGRNPNNCINYSDIYVLSNQDGRYANDGTVQCGGIVGHPGAVYGKVVSCINYGNVEAISGDFLYCGGISGEYGSIHRCENYGNVSGETRSYNSSSSFAGNCNVGGIVGATSGETMYSVNYGNISSYALKGGTSYSGGIAGYNGYYSSGVINNCINSGDKITSKRQSKSNGIYVNEEGISGRIAGVSYTTKECYSSCTTTINNKIPTENIGTNSINGASLSTDELKDAIENNYAGNNKIRYTFPKNGEVQVNPKLYGTGYDITICFDGIVTSGNGNIRIINLDTEDVKYYDTSYSSDIQLKENVLTIANVQLDYNTKYSIQFDDGCVYVDGKIFFGLSQENDWTFITTKSNDDNEETTIKTIRKTPIKQYDSYNVVKYADTDSGKIIKAAVNYNKAIEDYLSKINKQASNDIKGNNTQRKSVGKQLMEKDKNVHTLKYVASAEYAIAAYEMLAEYYDECTKTGIDIGKIKITDDYITISRNIIKKIMNSIDCFERTSRINGHTVHADIFAFGGAISGSSRITVDGVLFIVSSSYDDVAKVMTDYINNLSDVTKDVLKQALFSILTELAHYTYIDQFTEDELKSLFKGKIESLQKMGYGNLLKVLKGAKKTYNIAKKITVVKSTADLKEALSIDNLKEIYKELSDADFSDNTIKNETVNNAYKSVMELKKALEDDLFNYIYGYKKEDEGFWQLIKRKININCPVDFTIYDTNNSIVASIINGVAKSNDSNIVLELNGDEKVIYILDERYINLRMTATDDGTMDIIIEDMSDGKPISRLNYYDIKLTDESAYIQELNSDSISGQLNQFPIIYDNDVQINANDYFETTDDACVNVKCTSSEGGYVENDLSETFVKGDPVELYAIAYGNEFKFDGWYVNDKLVEISPLYRFTAKSDISVYASFKKTEVNYLTELYDIEYGNEYDDFAWINVYDKDTYTYDIELKMYGIGETENDISTLKIAYKKGDKELSQEKTVVLDENGEAYLDKTLKKGYEIITIKDKRSNLVATLVSNGELPETEPSPNVTANPNPTIKPSQIDTLPNVGTTVSPSATVKPTVVPTTVPASVITPTPESSVVPINMPDATVKPTETPLPSVQPDKEDNKSNSVKKLKKGSKVTDKKTKAVYKITSTEKNRTVEYAKSTKKKPTSISVPASVKLKGKTYKVTSVGKAAFKNSKKLKTVKLGKNVKTISKQAFSGCVKLTNITISKNVTTIGANAFRKCSALTIITIPSKVTKIGNKAFYQCKNLRYILVKTKKLTAKNVGSNAFGKGATNLWVKTDKTKWRLYAQIFIAKGMSKKALFIIDPVKLVI